MATATLDPVVTTRTSPFPIGPDSAGLRMTPEEFDAIEDFDESCRYELIDGVLVVNPIPLEAEADPNDTLGYLLHDYRRRHPNGRALDKTLPERHIRVGKIRRRADRVIWCGLGRRPNPRRDIPQVAVEFVSAGKRNWTRDYDEKRAEYHAVGVVEYWIIDRFRRTMTVHRRVGSQSTTLIVNEHDVYRTELLPGFELLLAELLAAADEWNENG
jgi:Uma2 family endonuclease